MRDTKQNFIKAGNAIAKVRLPEHFYNLIAMYAKTYSNTGNNKINLSECMRISSYIGFFLYFLDLPFEEVINKGIENINNEIVEYCNRYGWEKGPLIYVKEKIEIMKKEGKVPFSLVLRYGKNRIDDKLLKTNLVGSEILINNMIKEIENASGNK